MATAIKRTLNRDLSIQLDRAPGRSGPISRMTLQTRGLDGTRCEQFLYRELTLPPKIWSRVYDALGNVVEENLSEPDGSLVFRWTYLLDRYGRRIQGNLHNRAGVLLATWFYNEHQELTTKLNFTDAAVKAA